MRRHRRWLKPVLVVLAVLAGWDQREQDTEQLERDLRLHTGGGAGEDANDLAQTLIAEGVPRDEAVDVAVTLSRLGGDALADLKTARLLAHL